MFPALKRFCLRAVIVGAAWSHAAIGESPDRPTQPFYGASPAAATALAQEFAALIAAETQRHGSRQAASAARIDEGTERFLAGEVDDAMRRFNEAWLLDPENSRALLGFAAVHIDRAAYCDAVDMIRLAESRGPLYPGFLPEAGIAHTGCALRVQNDDPEIARQRLADADRYLALAYAHPEVPRAAALFQWARALYARGDYAAAWAKVAEYRIATGQDFNAQFLRALKRKMPEPRASATIGNAVHAPRHAVIQAALGQ